MPLARVLPRFLLLAALALAASVRLASAAEFHDDFSLGLRTQHWTVTRSPDAPPYTAGVASGELRLAHTLDSSRPGRQWVRALLHHALVGDFSVEVQYHGAVLARALPPIGGSLAAPGNSVRLVAHTRTTRYEAVRSNEQDAIPDGEHAWIEPPAFAYGRRVSASNSGLLRISRTGFLLQVSADGVPLTTTFAAPDSIVGVALELRNEGTADSISVRFDDVAITADEIVPDAAVLGFTMLDVPPPPPGTSLEAAPNPAAGRVALRLSLATTAPVRLEVLDPQGRVRVRLADGPLDAGAHAFAWSPTATVPPGVYFAVARVDGRAIVRRLVLVR